MCIGCKYFGNCSLEYEAEMGETIEGIPIEDPVFDYGLEDYSLKEYSIQEGGDFSGLD